MNSLVLDTNALIRFLEHGQDYTELFAEFNRLLIPAIVDGEYRAGIDSETAAGRRRAVVLDALLSASSVEFVPVDRNISAQYAAVFRQLRQQGTPIPQNDIWIAATAMVYDATLCSFDKHFATIRELKLLPIAR